MANNYIGVAWRKTTKEGKTYLSGVLRDLSGDIQIAIFPNNKKEQPNQPDFNIVRSEKQKNKPVANCNDTFGNTEPSFQSQEQLAEDIRMEDIPF